MKELATHCFDCMSLISALRICKHRFLLAKPNIKISIFQRKSNLILHSYLAYIDIFILSVKYKNTEKPLVLIVKYATVF